MSAATPARERTSRAAPGRRRPSDPPSLLAALIIGIPGVLLVLIGWISVSGNAAFDDQTVGLNLAILGALVVLAGCGFYLFMFRRRIEQRTTALCVATLGEDEEG
jgi:TRAP-type C4-dicarboxylate transport system permease small subunit